MLICGLLPTLLLPTLLAPTLLVAGPASAGIGPAPSEPSEPVAVDASPVDVEVTGLAPRAPLDAGEPLQVTGRLVNRGPERVDGLRLQLHVGAVVRSRSALAAATDNPGLGRPRAAATEPSATSLEPGGSTPFDLRLRVGDLGLTRIGVYPVQLQVTGRAEGARRGSALGQASTFVPWFPDGPPRPTRLAFLWPLIDEPDRAPDGALLDEHLAESVATDGGEGAGRLGRLLTAARTGAPGACDVAAQAPPDDAVPPAADSAGPPCRGEPVPITYAVDPALLEAVAALGGEHSVIEPGGARTTRPASADAREWLELLREALAGAPARNGAPALPAADLLAVPYADPDVVALTRSRTGLSDDVEQLRLLGRRLAGDVTGAEPLEELAWPPAGQLTAAALDASVSGGATAVVLDEAALPARRFDAGRTPGARTELSSASGGLINGLVVDDGLSRLLAAGPDDDDWQGARLAEQRWIAETAIIAAERPGESRTMLVAPPRRGDVVPAVAGQALLDAGRLPWLCAVALTAVAAGTERCAGDVPAEPVVDERGNLQPADGEDEVSPRFLQQVAAVRARADQFTDQVLVAGSEQAAQTKARLLRARGRTESSAWRSEPVRGRLMLAMLREEVDRLRGQVQLITSGSVLLTSDSGVISVDVSNALDQPVTVGVQLNDPIEARLTSSDTDVRTIGAGQQVPVRVRVEARVSGQFVVRATLLDRAGQPFGEPVELIARSTGYGRLALAITGVGAGVLLLAAGVRITRRALRRRPEAAVPLSEDELGPDDRT